MQISDGSNLQITLPVTVGNINRSTLICQWIRCTGFAAGKSIWNFGSTAALPCLETTDTLGNLRVKVNAATDGVWDISSSGMETNKWMFIAVLLFWSASTTTYALKVWVGGYENYPEEKTVTTTTSPSGTLTGSTTLNIGAYVNTGVNAAAGEYGPFIIVSSTVPDGPIYAQSAGVLVSDESDFIYRTLVVPIWKRSEVPEIFSNGRRSQAAYFAHLYPSLILGYPDDERSLFIPTGSAGTPSVGWTLGSASSASYASPRPFYGIQNQRPLLRR